MSMEFLMQRKKLKNKVFIIFIISLLLRVPCYSKSGSGHSIDMLSVLGLFSESDKSTSYYNQTQLQDLFNMINDYIDTLNIQGHEGITDNFYDEVKKNFAFAYEQKYTHRELYHWGFDLDVDLTSEGIPSDNQIPEALRKTFILWNGDYGEDVVSEWHRFLKFLQKEQSKRYSYFISSVKTVFGLASSNDARDIAAILYYTHLLGDHVEHVGVNSGDAVLEMDKIVKNIDMHIKFLSQKSLWFYNDYKKAIQKLRKVNDREYAKNVLDTLSFYLPKILKFRFANNFAAKNLKFIFEEELLKVS